MSKYDVAVIDYGMGNLLSVCRGLEYVGAKVIVSSNPDVIFSASRVVLPGVGAFASAMQALEQLGLVAVIRKLDASKVPVLGICLGMQLLLDQSEEFGFTKGLGLIPGNVMAIPRLSILGETQKIPHIGWSAIYPANPSIRWANTVLENISPGDAVYFVHSFMAVPKNPEHQLADCIYGGHRIPAVISHKHVLGCQFHPEKSGEVGLKILRKFIDL